MSEYGAERLRTNRRYNMDLFDDIEFTSDKFEMPIIKAEDITPSSLVGFNYALNRNPDGSFIHFYLDDYQFERVWNKPKIYVELFKRWGGIIAPDFSTYLDMPQAQQIFNVYRSRLLGAYFQSMGIKVIPCAQWSDPRSFEYCFKGIEKNGTVAVSTVGVMRHRESRFLFVSGLTELIEQVQPQKIVLYGKTLEFDFGDIEIIEFENKESRWGK